MKHFALRLSLVVLMTAAGSGFAGAPAKKQLTILNDAEMDEASAEAANGEDSDISEIAEVRTSSGQAIDTEALDVTEVAEVRSGPVLFFLAENETEGDVSAPIEVRARLGSLIPPALADSIVPILKPVTPEKPAKPALRRDPQQLTATELLGAKPEETRVALLGDPTTANGKTESETPKLASLEVARTFTSSTVIFLAGIGALIFLGTVLARRVRRRRF